MNRWLGAEIYLVHVGHGLLYVLVLGIVAWHVPWWALLLGSPLVLFSAVFWLYEARYVLPPATRMLRGESGGPVKEKMATTTTAPRGGEAARPTETATQTGDETRGNRWRI